MLKNAIYLATGALLFAQSGLAQAPFNQTPLHPAREPRATDLQAPVRILAAGKPIDVTTGHAAPYVRDCDGDGVRDLIVGEFGDGKFPDHELPECLAEGWKKGGRFANGRLRVYKNHGTNSQPRFEDFEYLEAGGDIATVPIT
tara:strand:+ start:4077 stop:4505 length:429 start_codon:yes stop_codon:yes gene_type:complete